MKRLNTVLAATLLSVGAVGSAISDEKQTTVGSEKSAMAGDEWVISTTPYIWLLFFNGDMTINGQTVDMSGTSVFDLLDAGDLRFPPAVNYFEARKGRWGGYLDTTFVGMEFAFSDVTLLPGPVVASAGVDFSYALINAGVIYTVDEWQTGSGYVAFDAMLGMRYTYYNIDLNVTAGPVGFAGRETLDWFDVTLGGRLRGQYDNGWGFNILADVAGGGIESDFSVHAIANVTKKKKIGSFDTTFIAGYRLFYQDWNEGNDAVDLLSHGPLAGFRIHF